MKPPTIKSNKALDEPEFRWLIASNAVFFLCLQGQILTRSVLAWNLTGDEMSLAYVNLSFAVPMLMFSLLGGALSDRIDRKKLIVIGQIILCFIEFVILCLLVMDKLQFWHMLVGAATAGSILPFSMPARTAIVFNIVGAHRLSNAVAISSAVMNTGKVLGPLLMGLVIDRFTVTGAYFVSIILNSLALMFLLGVSNSPATIKQRPNIVHEVFAGLTYVFHHKPLFLCLSIGVIPMFLTMPFQNLLVLFAETVWSVGEQGLGSMMAAAGMGGVIGSFWIARRSDQKKRTALMIASTMLFGACLIGFSYTPVFMWALVPLFIANIFASASQTLNSTICQMLVKDEMRGRISAIMLTAFGLTPLGVVPIAILAKHFGASMALSCASVTLILIMIAFYIFSPTLKNLDSTIQKKT